MGIMNVLAELHQEPDLKLNLKFEIEVLCKTLNLELGVSQTIFSFIIPNNNSKGNNNCKVNEFYSLFLKFSAMVENLRKSE